MRISGFIVLLFIIHATLHIGNTQSLTLSGKILDQGSGEPLIQANIWLKELDGKGAVSNETGYFSLKIKPGRYTLAVSYVGYNTLEQNISIRSDTFLQIGLTPFVLDAVEITAPRERLNPITFGRFDIPLEYLKKMPALMGEPDPIKGLALLPGISTGQEGTTGLFVRGGTPDQNQILLDGANIYNASHLFGFLSVFNPNTVKSMSVYKSGFPSQFGGRLSSILDIHMKEGNLHKRSRQVSVGLINSSWVEEGPIKPGKSSFLIAGRAAYLGLISQIQRYGFLLASVGNSVSYNLFDLNAKLNYHLPNHAQLSITGFANGDFYANSEKRDVTIIDTKLRWGNQAGSLIYTQPLWSGWQWKSIAGMNHFHYRLQNTFKSFQEEDAFSGVFINRSKVQDVFLRTRLSGSISPNYTLHIAAEGGLQSFLPGSIRLGDDLAVFDSLNFDSRQKIATRYAAAGIDQEFTFGILQLRAGLRFSHYAARNRSWNFLDPRLALQIQPAENWRISLAYDRMYQPLHLLTQNTAILPTDVWAPATPTAPPQQSDQYSLGVSWVLPDSAWQLSMETYYKHMSGISDFRPGANLILNLDQGWESVLNAGGLGKVAGMEWMLQKSKGSWQGWIAYTLSRNQRSFSNLLAGQWVPFKYDRRHDLSISGSYKLKGHWDFSATFVFSSGFPINLPVSFIPSFGGDPQFPVIDEEIIPVYSGYNNRRLPPYHRLDLGAHHTKITKRGKERTWSFSVYNVYSRQNPVSIRHRATWVRNENNKTVAYQPVTELHSLFGIIPSISLSIKK